MSERLTTVALVVAAGRGTRFGGARPKAYARFAGRPLLRQSLATLAQHPGVDAVRAVIHADDRELYDEAAAGLDLLEPVPGGAERQDSVRIGLESLRPFAPTRVLIHDGARPLLDAALVDRVLDRLEAGAAAVLPALPVTDTLKRAEGGLVLGEVDRAGCVRVQTPQGFAFDAILAAHRACAGQALTDDGAVAAAAAGLDVALVAGSERNLKVTEADDLARAEALLCGGLLPCVGTGLDVHRFGAGDHVMLCGVPVPHDAGLVGHSDADVGLHALTDAILGALGAGDIGWHFPPSEPRWRGAASALFVAHALGLVRAAGGRLRHVDVTLICERPKIGPYRSAMLERLAGLLDLPPARIGLKATTTEGLGFAGRAEGIAAQAAATVLLPA